MISFCYIHQEITDFLEYSEYINYRKFTLILTNSMLLKGLTGKFKRKLLLVPLGTSKTLSRSFVRNGLGLLPIKKAYLLIGC